MGFSLKNIDWKAVWNATVETLKSIGRGDILLRMRVDKLFPYILYTFFLAWLSIWLSYKVEKTMYRVEVNKEIIENLKIDNANKTCEIVSLNGTVSRERCHLHIALSREDLSTVGGHLFGRFHTVAAVVQGGRKRAKTIEEHRVAVCQVALNHARKVLHHVVGITRRERAHLCQVVGNLFQLYATCKHHHGVIQLLSLFVCKYCLSCFVNYCHNELKIKS